LHVKKHLGFNALRKTITEHILEIEDFRQPGKVDYCIHDVLMSGFAMMFFQDPSLLAFQRRLQEKAQQNNISAIFNISSIPKDSQLRDVIDQVPTEKLNAIFPKFIKALQRGRQLPQYRFIDGKYLVPIDGSQYFSSSKINCPYCLKTKSRKKELRYHHQILQAVIVKPGLREVLPLFPETIQNSDGSTKQDCEINAGKRILGKIRKAHPKLPLIIAGDGLYSKQPFIDSLKQNAMSYILVAKPADHKILFQWVDEITDMGEAGHFQCLDKKGRIHKYHWVNDVPINGSPESDHVNFFQYWLVNEQGKTTYHNSWVTDIYVSADNVETLVKGGRARWKIENETFNTLKNQGYHIEHNYGHGRKYLSMNFFVLNLLAFFVHQILELCDHHYRRCRFKFSSRKEFWNVLKYSIRLILFRDFYHLLDHNYKPVQIRAP
jgi:hypothetical protein